MNVLQLLLLLQATTE